MRFVNLVLKKFCMHTGYHYYCPKTKAKLALSTVVPRSKGVAVWVVFGVQQSSTDLVESGGGGGSRNPFQHQMDPA